MKHNWILDNGHGGLVDGEYTTCPDFTEDPSTWHKMHIHDGKPFYEGVFNRLVVDEISLLLSIENIEHQVLVPEHIDIPLGERAYEVNDQVNQGKSCILVSIHGNAFNGMVQGYEVFAMSNASMAVGDVFAEEMNKEFPERKMRWGSGRKTKYKNLFLLRETNCRAVLTENFFFDNPDDCNLMSSKEGIHRIAKAHVEAIKRIEG